MTEDVASYLSNLPEIPLVTVFVNPHHPAFFHSTTAGDSSRVYF